MMPSWRGAQVPREVRRAARMGDMWVPSPTPDYDVLEKYFRRRSKFRSISKMIGFPYKIIIAYVILECVNDALHTSYIVGVTLSSFLELLDALCIANLMLPRKFTKMCKTVNTRVQ